MPQAATTKKKPNSSTKQPENQPELSALAGRGMTYVSAHVLRLDSPPIIETVPTLDSAGALVKRENGMPTSGEMALISKLASGNVQPEQLYAFDSAISNQRLDSYFTRMDVSSLENYVSDANRSSPLMNSHRTGGWSGSAELPIGRSFFARLDDDPQLSGGKRAVASAYMLRGITPNSVNTNDLIASIDAGVISDVSIGFYYFAGTPERKYEDKTWLRCSICGLDWLEGDPWGWYDEDEEMCRHWPGETYAYEGGTNKQLCWLDVMSARLAEYSLVYSGATDGAIILKAERAAQAGVLTRSQLGHLENSYGIRLNDRANIYLPEKAALRKIEDAAIESQRAATDLKTLAGDVLTDLEIAQHDRSKNSMPKPNKTEDQARQEGERDALVRLLQSIVDSNPGITEAELRTVQGAMESVAAGDHGAATRIIASLTTGRADASDDETDPNMEMGTEGDESGALATSNQDASEMLGNEPDEDEGETSAMGDRGSGTIPVSLSLTVSERTQFKSLQTEVKALRRRVQELEPLAEVGQTYRDELIAETVKQANRAQVKGMDEARVQRICAQMDIEDIKALCTDYRQRAYERLSQHDDDGSPLMLGGRQTQSLDPNAVPALVGAGATGGSGTNKPRDIGAYNTSARR